LLSKPFGLDTAGLKCDTLAEHF